MKKLIKQINFKLILFILALILLEVVTFVFTKPFINNPYVLGSLLDDNIPFIPHFIWIYVFWYAMLIIIPYYIAKKDLNLLIRYSNVFIISTLISGIIFLVFPNTVIRANIQGNDIASNVVKFIYMLDTPALNCFPSIHCLFSFLFIYGIFDCKEKVPVYIKITITILSLLVVLSTLFIKQHVIYDAIGALIISSTVWFIVKKYNINIISATVLKYIKK